MPPCVKCDRRKCTVCEKCYAFAIEELTEKLETAQADLRVAQAKIIFLQAITRAKVLGKPSKNTEVINLPRDPAKTSNEDTGT